MLDVDNLFLEDTQWQRNIYISISPLSGSKVFVVVKKQARSEMPYRMLFGVIFTSICGVA